VGLRVGLIGTGFGLKVQLPGLVQVPGIEVTGICSARLERAEAVSRDFSIPFATDDYRALVARDDVDLVSVCVPPVLHEEIAIAAIAAGKHVLCEKPLAPSVEACQRMEKLAKDAGVVHVVDHTERFLPHRRYLRDLAAGGYLGEPRLVHVSVNRAYVMNPDLEPHWFTWVSERDKGGGLLASLLTHHLDLARYTFGDITDVDGWTAITVPDRPVLPWDYRDGDPLGSKIVPVRHVPTDVEDTVVAYGKIGHGLFNLSSTWAGHHGTGVRVEAYGSEGSLVLEPDGTILGARSGESALVKLPLPDEYRLTYDGPKQVPSFARLMENVLESLVGTQEPLYASFSDGVLVQEMVTAINSRAPIAVATDRR
jgi:predicted dehydrogenase